MTFCYIQNLQTLKIVETVKGAKHFIKFNQASLTVFDTHSFINAYLPLRKKERMQWLVVLHKPYQIFQMLQLTD